MVQGAWEVHAVGFYEPICSVIRESLDHEYGFKGGTWLYEKSMLLSHEAALHVFHEGYRDFDLGNPMFPA